METLLKRDATITSIGHPFVCRRCNDTVTYARTRSGKNILMDHRQSPSGKFAVVGRLGHEAIVAKLENMPFGAARYSCHWDHCKSRRQRSAPRATRPLNPAELEFKQRFDARAKRGA
jgi:hypothetical protein